ncbi:MAG: hypothetical protein FJX37_07065 [Alphaproteobacteria bacterium]|nr:hypothetical protein [Alphaproteobacteria bacterium]MBM3733195.1 hypothetical protein [Acidimicrobiia bacterium]
MDAVAEHVLWTSRKRPTRVWSAGCAAGQEPYSLAMILIEVFRGATPPVDILATDIARDALAHARLGVYTGAETANVSSARHGRFFTIEANGHHAVRANVRGSRTPTWPGGRGRTRARSTRLCAEMCSCTSPPTSEERRWSASSG